MVRIFMAYDKDSIQLAIGVSPTTPAYQVLMLIQAAIIAIIKEQP